MQVWLPPREQLLEETAPTPVLGVSMQQLLARPEEPW